MGATKSAPTTSKKWPDAAAFREALAIVRRATRKDEDPDAIASDLVTSWNGQVPFPAFVATFVKRRAASRARDRERSTGYEQRAAADRAVLTVAPTVDDETESQRPEPKRQKSPAEATALMTYLSRFIEAEAAHVAMTMFNHGKVVDGEPAGASYVAFWLELALKDLCSREEVQSLQLKTPPLGFRTEMIRFVEETKKKQGPSGWVERLDTPPRVSGRGRPRTPRVVNEIATTLDEKQVVTAASVAWTQAREDVARRIVRHALALCGLPKRVVNRLTAADRVAERHFVEKVVRKTTGPGRGRRPKKRI